MTIFSISISFWEGLKILFHSYAAAVRPKGGIVNIRCLIPSVACLQKEARRSTGRDYLRKAIFRSASANPTAFRDFSCP